MANDKNKSIEAAKAAEAARIEALKGKAFTRAARDLREAHKDDWERFLRQRYEEYELEWNPRKTAEEREQEELEKLVAKHPDLARRLTQRKIVDDEGFETPPADDPLE